MSRATSEDGERPSSVSAAPAMTICCNGVKLKLLDDGSEALLVNGAGIESSVPLNCVA